MLISTLGKSPRTDGDHLDKPEAAAETRAVPVSPPSLSVDFSCCLPSIPHEYAERLWARNNFVLYPVIKLSLGPCFLFQLRQGDVQAKIISSRKRLVHDIGKG